MKTFCVLSDTHGNVADLQKLEGVMRESDYVIHLGDNIADTRFFPTEITKKLYAVKGNCDGGGEDQIIEVEGKRILLTHGDRYNVKSGTDALYYRAQGLNADAVFYGHTHKADIEERAGVIMINPGTLKGYVEKSYCYVVLVGGKFIAKIVYL